MDLVIAEQLLEFRAGEKIEVALAPLGAPGIAFACCGFHFLVGVSKMDDEFGDTRLDMFESIFIESGPFRGWKARLHGDDAIDDHVVRTKTFFKIGKTGKPIARNQDWEMVFMSDAQYGVEKILVGLEKAILMGIEMRGSNAHGEGAHDLRANFCFDVLGIAPSFKRPVVVKVAVSVHQGRDSV